MLSGCGLDATENSKILHFVGAAYVNGYLWTSALEWNGYYRISFKTQKTDFLGLFKYADILADKMFNQVLAYQEFVFFIPWFSDYLVRLNTNTLEIKYWKLPQEIVLEKAKFRAANLFKNKIYMFPMFGAVICIFDIEKEKFILEIIELNKKEKYSDFLQGYQIENHIYLPVYSKNVVLNYELNTGEDKWILFPEEEKGILNVEQYNEGELLFLTFRGNIWKYNITNKKIELFYEYNGDVECPYGHIIYHNDNLYLVPAKEKHIKVLKREGCKILCYPSDWNIKYINVFIESLFSGYHKDKSKILLYPTLGNMMIQIDTDTNLLNGIWSYDDIVNREKKIIRYLRENYPFEKKFMEAKMDINFFGNIVKIEKPLKNKSLGKIGDKVWREIR